MAVQGVDEVPISAQLLGACAAAMLPGTGALQRGVALLLQAASTDVGTAALQSMLWRHPGAAPLVVATEQHLPGTAASPAAAGAGAQSTAVGRPTLGRVPSTAGQGPAQLPPTDVAAAAATSQLLQLLPQVQAVSRRLVQCDPGVAPTLQAAGLWLKASTRFRAMQAAMASLWSALAAAGAAQLLLLSGSRRKGLQAMLSALGPEVEQAVTQAQTMLGELKNTRVSAFCWIRSVSQLLMLLCSGRNAR